MSAQWIPVRPGARVLRGEPPTGITTQLYQRTFIYDNRFSVPAGPPAGPRIRSDSRRVLMTARAAGCRRRRASSGPSRTVRFRRSAGRSRRRPANRPENTRRGEHPHHDHFRRGTATARRPGSPVRRTVPCAPRRRAVGTRRSDPIPSQGEPSPCVSGPETATPLPVHGSPPACARLAATFSISPRPSMPSRTARPCSHLTGSPSFQS